MDKIIINMNKNSYKEMLLNTSGVNNILLDEGIWDAIAKGSQVLSDKLARATDKYKNEDYYSAEEFRVQDKVDSVESLDEILDIKSIGNYQTSFEIIVNSKDGDNSTVVYDKLDFLREDSKSLLKQAREKIVEGFNKYINLQPEHFRFKFLLKADNAGKEYYMKCEFYEIDGEQKEKQHHKQNKTRYNILPDIANDLKSKIFVPGKKYFGEIKSVKAKWNFGFKMIYPPIQNEESILNNSNSSAFGNQLVNQNIEAVGNSEKEDFKKANEENKEVEENNNKFEDMYLGGTVVTEDLINLFNDACDKILKSKNNERSVLVKTKKQLLAKRENGLQKNNDYLKIYNEAKKIFEDATEIKAKIKEQFEELKNYPTVGEGISKDVISENKIKADKIKEKIKSLKVEFNKQKNTLESKKVELKSYEDSYDDKVNEDISKLELKIKDIDNGIANLEIDLRKASNGIMDEADKWAEKHNVKYRKDDIKNKVVFYKEYMKEKMKKQQDKGVANKKAEENRKFAEDIKSLGTNEKVLLMVKQDIIERLSYQENVVKGEIEVKAQDEKTFKIEQEFACKEEEKIKYKMVMLIRKL